MKICADFNGRMAASNLVQVAPAACHADCDYLRLWDLEQIANQVRSPISITNHSYVYHAKSPGWGNSYRKVYQLCANYLHIGSSK